jgi:Ferritin-like domain
LTPRQQEPGDPTALRIDARAGPAMIRFRVRRVVTKKSRSVRCRPTSKGGEMHDHRDDSELSTVTLPAAPDVWDPPTTRKGFLKGAAVAGLGAASFGAVAPAALARAAHKHGGLTRTDISILGAAQVAEALAVTTYMNIINTAPFFKNLASDDQGYLKAALQEEMSHYLLEQGLTKKPAAFTTFYYPAKMFTDAQTTLNILVTLEDAFIAAYLIGVRDFSNSALRVTAARIMGIESDHRTLARVVGPGVAGQDGGPVEQITGIQKSAESVDPPNNNGYERTLKLKNIGGAVEALKPFISKTAAQGAGFDPTKPYKFAPFTPTLPGQLGEFHSLKG